MNKKGQNDRRRRSARQVWNVAEVLPGDFEHGSRFLAVLLYHVQTAMGGYSDSEDWKDIVPIPQDDGGPNPLAAIAYTEEYSEAMSYLRAVMSIDEKSDRVLGLTEHIIQMNPAHYTVWLAGPLVFHHPQLFMSTPGFTEQTF